MVHAAVSNVVSFASHQPFAPQGTTRTICQLGHEQVVVSFGRSTAERFDDEDDYAEYAERLGAFLAAL